MSISLHSQPSSDPVLQDGEVHIWWAFPDCCQDPDLITTYLGWMDEQERARYFQFKFPQHRLTYLVAHALLHECLSHYHLTHPTKITFLKDRYGKPRLLTSEATLPLQFSLSHTDGLVACAVILDREVGIDVENLWRKIDPWSIAKSSFAPEEIVELKKHSTEDQLHYFFQHWTLKEAYAKANGKGLYLSFATLSFQLSPDTEQSIVFTDFSSEKSKKTLQSWRFAIIRPTTNHYLSLAINSPELLTALFVQSVPGVKRELVSSPRLFSQGIEFPPCRASQQ